MNWTLYTTATAAETDYDAALARAFGTGASDARSDCAHNGSRPDHPLHPLYAAKTEASDAWRAETQKAEAAA